MGFEHCVANMFLVPLAIKLGATKKELDSLVGIHPTAAEELLGLAGPDRTVTPAAAASKDGAAVEGGSGSAASKADKPKCA